MGAAEGEFPKVDGDILYGSESNLFFNKGLILSDDAGPYTNVTTTQNLVVTHVIGAGDVNDSIDIFIDKLHNLYKNQSGNGSGANDYYIRIDIGETGSEVTKRTIFNKIGPANVLTLKLDETNIFNYSPTTDEKTNGFNIKIYIYLANIADSNPSIALTEIGRTFVRNI